MSFDNNPLKIVSCISEFKQVIQLRKDIYSEKYPSVDLSFYDIFDFHASIWLGQSDSCKAVSTSRLVCDSDSGLPSEKYIKKYINHLRMSGYKLAEFGRLINIDKSSVHNVSAHFREAYLNAVFNSVDTILLVTSAHKKAFYSRRIGAKVLCDDIGENFGSDDVFSLYAWHLDSTSENFFSWVRLPMSKRLVS